MAEDDGHFSLRRESEKLPFLSLFVLFRPSVIWMMPEHMGEDGSLLSLLI